ncbi:acyl-CoA dehydratase activase-related protein [Guggenheimella bovis]
MIRVGLDIGSTTVKLVALDMNDSVLYKEYTRHFSSIQETILTLLKNAEPVLKDETIAVNITGSGGFSIAQKLDFPFTQEVISSEEAIRTLIPETDVAIELGGEDAKITYFDTVIEQRMNGTCAGGTGSFIDQMATLLKTDASGLNELAKRHETIYPIASRCGVFAKSDIQPLLNDGARREDVAVSVLQAVVNQTIAGLSQGKPIRGKVALLGGPLYFLSELRERFKETLGLTDETMIVPADAHFFVALGAARLAPSDKSYPYYDLLKDFTEVVVRKEDDELDLEPLFKSDEELEAFRERHGRKKAPRKDLATYSGESFLGIDAGSTTTKVVLLSSDGSILFEHYGSNHGNPLRSTVEVLLSLYEKLPDDVQIKASCVTGYGEELLKNALQVDFGEIETVCHAKAASFFLPEVDFVLDIGGQDMKSMSLKDGVIEHIMLNEACSSGCGSFIETFSRSVNLPVKDFATLGLKAERPVDLGTRCTVFMNSRVKQAQKEGASTADISAGISLSVIKNALYKVIRLRSPEDLGKHIVAQGGTFYNDSVLRAMEEVSGREVVRPDIAGLMGAFGAALIAKENAQKESALLPSEKLQSFSITTEVKRCEKCTNHCLLTINHFPGDRTYITGNRCERGRGEEIKEKLPNLYSYKYKRLFQYVPLKDAPRGSIGIPRTLNLYEDYPFWFTFFTELGYRVELSRKSSHDLFLKGMDSIPSESVCYPAKLTHGHIEDLLERGIKKIFYPCVPFIPKEDEDAGNHYNCPIVTSYPETLRANIEGFKDPSVKFMNPFLPLDDAERLRYRLHEELKSEGIPTEDIDKALIEAHREKRAFLRDIEEEGDRILEFIEKNHLKGIVLAGRPYHVDPEIHHGISEMITSMGFPVLTEDSVCKYGKLERPIRVVDQWVYHNRMYRAARFVAERSDLELVQLVSFGCGLDAITSDQVKEILEQYGKIYTMVKIDEISNLGAVRIRIRSLIASLKERDRKAFKPKKIKESPKRVLFTEKMREEYTILAPQMSPIHFELIEPAVRSEGYNLEILPSVDREAIDVGLKYVHNDACYPTIITVGQMMHALLSGKYDLNKTAVIISQTGGGCRATNYIAFIRKALQDANLGHIPVISLNAVGLEKQPGFNVSLSLLEKLIHAVIYGDVFMRVLYKTRPYEIVKGSADALHTKWKERVKKDLKIGKHFKKNLEAIVQEFDELPIDTSIKKPRVGVVGEILLKFHPTANNRVVELLESEGAEAVVPDLLDFFSYCAYNATFKEEYLSGSKKTRVLSDMSLLALEWSRKEMRKVLKKSKRFKPPVGIKKLAKKASQVLSLGNQTGEGWFLTAEMIELIESGVESVLCLQPFGCLPNHITGKGMVKAIRERFPEANIVPIDYDPGASEVNQLNRIKLMLQSSYRKMNR